MVLVLERRNGINRQVIMASISSHSVSISLRCSARLGSILSTSLGAPEWGAMEFHGDVASFLSL